MESTVIIALGSNFDPQDNIGRAREELRSLFPDIVFSRSLWTEPIGITSGRFINAMALAHSDLPKEEVERHLKRIERECGRCVEEKKKGIIRLDLDLMQWGEEKLRPKDWDREYILTLRKELP